ncbi:MAG: hypothetical protein VST68_00710 [Nitrospirota bacterium]|nr:hypothetical protein [Nitrospirota bacterium]
MIQKFRQSLKRSYNRRCHHISYGIGKEWAFSPRKFWECASIVVVSVLAAIGLASPSLSEAQLLDPHVGVTIKAGTTGVGIDLTKSIFQDVNIRAGYNGFQYSDSLTESGIQYDGDLRLETIPVFLDWHVFSGGFRMSTGLFYNNNTLDLTSRATGTVVVGNTSIPASTLGTLNGKVEFGNMIVPYLGLGWGNAVDQDNRWGIAVDVGVFYQGKPEVTLTQSLGAVSAADLALEEQNLEDELDVFQFYPVATIGLFFRF